MRRFLGLSLATVWVAMCSGTLAAGDDGDDPPADVAINYYDASGKLGVAYSAPADSKFSTHGSKGGTRPPCTVTKTVEVENDDGTTSKEQKEIEGTWLFAQVSPGADEITEIEVDWPGPGDAYIPFFVSCKIDGALQFLETINVSIHDPFFWDEATFVELRAEMKLNPISIFEPDSVGRWGGIVVRNPVPLQVDANAWKAQSSPTRYRHGVALMVAARPRTLAFDVSWTPNENARDGATAQSWSTTCATAYSKASGAWFPEVSMPEQSQTVGLVDGQCGWVAPDSGEVAIKATITYEVVNVVNGFSLPAPDYVWSGEATFATGQLRAVNVKD